MELIQVKARERTCPVGMPAAECYLAANILVKGFAMKAAAMTAQFARPFDVGVASRRKTSVAVREKPSNVSLKERRLGLDTSLAIKPAKGNSTVAFTHVNRAVTHPHINQLLALDLLPE